MNSLYSPLVLDDRSSFVEISNVYINDLSLENIKQLSTTRFGKARLIPITSFALNHLFFKGNVALYHLTNIVIHLFATIALFAFLKGLLSFPNASKSLRLHPHGAAFFVCALWALNPVQTNAVTYLVQRMTSMAALFYFSSLAFYVFARKNEGITRYLLSLGCLISAILSFLSKEISATLPMVILLTEFTFISPGIFRKILKHIRPYQYVLLFIILILSLPLLVKPFNSYVLNSYQFRHFNIFERLLTESRIVVFYISLLFLPLPSRMNLDHDFPISYSLLSPPTTLLSILLLALIFIVAIWIRKKNPLASYGIFWFFINLIIESTIIPLELIFEHRLYLPSAGFFVVFVIVCDYLVSRLAHYDSLSKKRLMTLFLITLACVSSLLTTLRNEDWKSEFSIYNDMLKKSPNKARVYTNISRSLAQSGKYDEAIATQLKALDLGNDYYEETLNAYNNIMSIYLVQGRYEEALEEGSKFFDVATSNMNFRTYSKFMYNMAICHAKLGEYDKAVSCIINGLKEQPNTYFHVAKLLEQILYDVDKDEKWRKQFGLTGKEEEVHNLIAQILTDLRIYDKAVYHLNMSLDLNNKNESTIAFKNFLEEIVTLNQNALNISDIKSNETYKTNFVFRTYLNLSEFIMNNYYPLIPFVDNILEKAAKIDPQNPFVISYRIRWLAKTGKNFEAITEFENSIDKLQQFPPALEIAYSLYNVDKQEEKAFTILAELVKIFPGHPLWKRYDYLLYKLNKTESGFIKQDEKINQP